MALGTTLSATLDVSTTVGTQSLVFTADGRAVVQAAIDSGDKLTVCVMTYHHDYSNNAPTQDGDHTQILTYFSEGSGAQRPILTVEESGESTLFVYAENSGNDDDATIFNITADGSVSWDTIRGDADTTGTTRRDSDLYYSSAIFTSKITGRGSDVFTDNRRSYFVFDLGGIGGATADVVQLTLRCDNLGHTNADFGKIIAVQATALAGSTADYGNCFVSDAVAAADNAVFFGANF